MLVDESEIMLVSSPYQIHFLTGYSNFSKEEREAFLVLTNKNKYILTDARYSEAVAKLEKYDLLEISAKQSLYNHLEIIIKSENIQKILFEGDDLKFSEYKKLENLGVSLEMVELRHIRAVKDSYQISKIKNACMIGDQVFDQIIKKIRSGISERNLADEIEKLMHKFAARPSFDSIVAFGSNASIPHHQAGAKKLKGGGEFVLLDFGVKLDHYCSDMTRTIFLGKANSKQKKIYKTVYEAQRRVADFLDKKIKSGDQVTGQQVDQIAREFIKSQGYDLIPHSLGHGIGLQVHEYPSLSPKSDDVLLEGMVFSIEPGIYIPGFGGVRIEDLYVIEKNGLRQLTQSDKQLIEL